ncbi:MAG: DNA sulfur modification protein DndB [Actinobacteria bacterium]|nr:MAG: DNA sulfur modification protein DndB [Actinomycetota bacterium]
MASMEIAFPAIKGRQGARDYYVAMLPLKVIPRLFTFRDWAELPPEVRAQRTLSTKRVPEITRYILEHEDDWVFSSLTASFEADENFQPSELDPNIGVLRVPLDAEFLINDGQHRRAAIEEALKENKQLGDQTISVVFFPEEGIERNQQMFSDLNRTVQKTSRSLDILYDHRDPMNRVTQEVATAVAIFKNRVEKERVSLSARSPRFITLSALYDANEQLLGKMKESEADDEREAESRDLAVAYWDAVTENIPEWTMIRDGNLKPPEARAEFVHSHAVTFWALAAAGRDLIAQYPDEADWTARLAHLGEIDWRKNNRDWQGICMLGNDIVTRRQTREATADYIKWHLGLIAEKPGAVLEVSA